MKYLIDASAFYPLLQVSTKVHEIIVNGAMLGLTLYKLGNHYNISSIRISERYSNANKRNSP
jgi:hypothetical protein